MRKIDFSSSDWKMQLYGYTEELVRNTSKFADLPEYDLQDVIQDVYVRTLGYCTRRIHDVGVIKSNSDMGNWSNYIRTVIDAYSIEKLFCRRIPISGYSYIDDSTLVNKSVIKSIENLAKYRTNRNIYCTKEYFYGDRTLEDIAADFGVNYNAISQGIQRDLRRLRTAGWRIYKQCKWGSAYE